jgi:hypothetical protein
MRTETVNLYKFNELSERAKEHARERGRRWVSEDPAWGDESLDSIKAFCDRFGVDLKDWSVGAYCPFDFSTNAENRHFRGRKLRDFTRDNMPTGYCLDCALWGTFYDEFKRTGSAKKAFEGALWAGFKEWREDLEGQLEDEYIEDFLIANEYEFYENGNPH